MFVVTGKNNSLSFSSSTEWLIFFSRDGPDQPPSHFDPPGGSSYFHGGGGNFHPNFAPNVHPSAGAGGEQFNK